MEWNFDYVSIMEDKFLTEIQISLIVQAYLKGFLVVAVAGALVGALLLAVPVVKLLRWGLRRLGALTWGSGGRG